MADPTNDGVNGTPPFMSGAPQFTPTGVQFRDPLGGGAGFPTFLELWDGQYGTNGVVVATTDPVPAGFTQFTNVTENTVSGGVFRYADDGIGYKVIDVSSTGTASSQYGEWPTVGIQNAAFFRWGAKFTANPAAQLDVQQPRDTATRFRLRLNATGTVSIVNNSTVVATTTATIPLNTYFRVEWRAYADATNGEMELRLFPDLFGDVPTETLLVTGLSTGTTPITNIRNGNPFATANVAYKMVGVGVGDMGWIGPLPNLSISASASAELAAFDFGAFDATVSASSGGTSASANAGFADSAYSAFDATSTVQTNVEAAETAFAAFDAAASIRATAELAAAAFGASDASLSIRGSAELAGATFSANDIAPTVATASELAAFAFGALDATVSTSAPEIGRASCRERVYVTV